MTGIHWASVVVGLAAALAFLYLFPAPAGCGCAKRKRALEDLGGEWFGDAA